MQKSKYLAAVAFLSVFIGSPHRLQAQTNFYQGKTITIVVGTVPGGLYDRWGRLFGRVMGKYIPGNPAW
jgi:tripartite-type tricarboxylate transporter receptor subunit TctC